MRTLIAATLLGVLLMGAGPGALAPTSQAFADRAARIQQRITGAQPSLAPGEATLLQAELAAAQHANDTSDPSAASMLDVMERQLARIDRTLTRASDGEAIVVHPGDGVMVAMNDPYTYDLHISDSQALASRPGIMWAIGVQGVFTAKTPGAVTITLEPRAGTQPFPPANLRAPVVFTVIILPGQAGS